MTTQTKEQFCEEMEARSREIETMKTNLFAEIGLSPEPLEDPSDSPLPERWDVWVIDHIEMTSEIVLNSVEIEEAKEFESVWKETVASQLLDLSFGNADNDESSSRVNTVFQEAVIRGRPE